MWIEGQVGPQALIAGSKAVGRIGSDASFVTQDAHGRYQEAAFRGTMFYAANIAAQALSVASSTYTGLVLQNPLGSTKNLVLLEVIWVGSIVATGTGAIVLGWGNTQAAGVPVALTTGNSSGPKGLPAMIGSGTSSVANVGASCTWAVLGAGAAPTIFRPLIGAPWITATAQNLYMGKDEIAGGIIIPPGVQIGIETVTTANTGFGYYSWEEVPIVG